MGDGSDTTWEISPKRIKGGNRRESTDKEPNANLDVKYELRRLQTRKSRSPFRDEFLDTSGSTSGSLERIQ
jgi:hypothetical protein